MNETKNTKPELLDAAAELFATRGYDGTSVREITSAARANLGAVTYHFGSKEALYHAVVERATSRLRERLTAAAQSPGTPIERIEAYLVAYFEGLRADPALARLALQVLSSDRPLPGPIAGAVQANFGLVLDLMRAGQADGSIRAGAADVLTLIVAPLPVLFSLLRKPIEEVIHFGAEDDATWRGLVEHATSFVRRGLATEGSL